MKTEKQNRLHFIFQNYQPQWDTTKESISAQAHHQETLGSSPYFPCLLNLNSYLLLIPFTVHLNEVYELRTNIFRQIIAGTLHILAIYTQSKAVFFFKFNLESDTFFIRRIFDLVSHSGLLVMIIFFTKLIWLDRDKILILLECTRQAPKVPRLRRWWICFMKGFIVMTSLIFVVFSSWNAYRTYPLPITSGVEIYFASLCIVSCACFLYIIYYFIISLGFSVYHIGHDFASKLEDPKDVDLNTGMQLYYEMGKKCDSINEVCGSLLLVFYITMLCYVAVAPDVYFGLMNTAGVERYLYACFIGINVFWIVAGNFHDVSLQAMRKWMEFHTFQNQKLNSYPALVQMRFWSVRGEIVNGNCGIALSCKYFSVTNGFIGSMAGLILTYAIVIFQMQPRGNSNSTNNVTSS